MKLCENRITTLLKVIYAELDYTKPKYTIWMLS